MLLCAVFLPVMSHKRDGYADSWAVEIAGGETKARELADKHGFVYRGQVSDVLCDLHSLTQCLGL